MEGNDKDKVIVPKIGIDNFVNLLKNSVGIWMDPQFLNLVSTMSSPSSAYEEVFKRTSSKRKAKAARWFAIAVRDYDPLVVRGAIDFLKKQSSEGDKYLELKEYLRSMMPKATLTPKGDVAILKENDECNNREGGNCRN